jgi:hypothetical protein
LRCSGGRSSSSSSSGCRSVGFGGCNRIVVSSDVGGVCANASAGHCLRFVEFAVQSTDARKQLIVCPTLNDSASRE